MMEERLFEWDEETQEKARQYLAKRKRQLSRLNLVPLSPMESVRPPECTNPEKLWCPDRVFNQRYKITACRGNPCKPEKESRPRTWPREDMEMLSKNSHLHLDALLWLLGSYTKDEIRAKLEEVDPELISVAKEADDGA